MKKGKWVSHEKLQKRPKILKTKNIKISAWLYHLIVFGITQLSLCWVFLFEIIMTMRMSGYKNLKYWENLSIDVRQMGDYACQRRSHELPLSTYEQLQSDRTSSLLNLQTPDNSLSKDGVKLSDLERELSRFQAIFSDEVRHSQGSFNKRLQTWFPVQTLQIQAAASLCIK